MCGALRSIRAAGEDRNRADDGRNNGSQRFP
jgi:hypothetical protein